MWFSVENYKSKTKPTLLENLTLHSYYNLTDYQFNLYLEARRKINLEQICIRFVTLKKRHLFTDDEYENVPKEIIKVNRINDPKTIARYGLTNRIFKSCSDEKGGQYGYYNPIYNCPKKEILFFEIRPEVNVKKYWTGYISIQTLSGDELRTYTRNKISVAEFIN